MAHQYNPKIHHRRSIRLKGYDYSQAGLYFITICVQNKACLFGEITGGEMMLNNAGKIADECWLEIPAHFPNVVLHEYIIMPNHIHGIVELTDVGAKNLLPENVGANNHSPDIHGANNHSPYNHGAKNDLPDNHGAKNGLPENPSSQNVLPENGANNHSPLRGTSKTIGSIVRGFKIGVTKWMRQHTDVYDVWQRNYYEHIIRNELSYQRISEYILNNPASWTADKFYA